MTKINEKLREWVINKIKTEYADDVSLLIGFNALDLEEDKKGEAFDFYIPETDKGYNLSRTFIIDGVGYDLYPRSWERIEDMVNFDDYNSFAIADATVIYSRNKDDEIKFQDARKRFFDNLNNNEFVFKKALEKLNIAMNLYQTMMFEESVGKVRMAAGYITDYLAFAVAIMNNTYLKNIQTNIIEELSNMKNIPDNFIEYYKAIINAETIAELKNLSHLIISSTRKFLDKNKPCTVTEKNNINYNALADWYQELCYTWRRLYFAVKNNDTEKAFVWGCLLESELDIIKEEYNLKPMDLMGVYNSADLSVLQNRAKKLEEYIISVINENGVELKSYADINEFISLN